MKEWGSHGLCSPMTQGSAVAEIGDQRTTGHMDKHCKNFKYYQLCFYLYPKYISAVGQSPNNLLMDKSNFN